MSGRHCTGRIPGLQGAGPLAVLWHVYLPLARPVLVAYGLVSVSYHWNDFLWPLIVMRTEKMFTIPIGLNSLLTPYGNNYDMLLSGAFVATVPIIIVFLFFQRFFISGLSAGSIKG